MRWSSLGCILLALYYIDYGMDDNNKTAQFLSLGIQITLGGSDFSVQNGSLWHKSSQG